MKKNIIIYLLASLLLSNCQNRTFSDKLPLLLGLEKVDIEKVEELDDIGGIGEGKTIYIYVLSATTTENFLYQSEKKLPNKQFFFKQDWKKGIGIIDSIYAPIRELSLNYLGDSRIESQLNIINNLLSKTDKDNIYIAFYYNNENPELATKSQLIIFEIQENKLYIIDTVT